MSKREVNKRRTLPDEAREAALDSAAATLAAIHMAKKVGAELMPPRDGCGVRSPLTPDLRMPLGDVLFGVAQIQVDFVRRLFEFNKAASVKLRERLKTNLSAQAERAPIKVTQVYGAHCALHFTIQNAASLARMFEFHAEVCGFEAVFSPARAKVGAGKYADVVATFEAGLPRGVHLGHIEVESNGIRVERLPFRIKVK